MENLKFVRIKNVSSSVGLSKSYIYQLVQQGKFPKPIKAVPNSNTSVWIESEVINWMESRIADERKREEV